MKNQIYASVTDLENLRRIIDHQLAELSRRISIAEDQIRNIHMMGTAPSKAQTPPEVTLKDLAGITARMSAIEDFVRQSDNRTSSTLTILEGQLSNMKREAEGQRLAQAKILSIANDIEPRGKQ